MLLYINIFISCGPHGIKEDFKVFPNKSLRGSVASLDPRVPLDRAIY